MDSPCSKSGLGARVVIDTVWGEGCMVCDYSPRRTQRETSNCFVHTWRRSQHQVPSYTAISLFSSTPLASHCLNLLFGTQGGSGRLKPSSFLKETRDLEGLLFPGWGARALLSFFISDFSYFYPAALPSLGLWKESASHSVMPNSLQPHGL